MSPRPDRPGRPPGPRFHHVNVVVPPGTTAAAVPFYVDVLGLRQIDKPAEGVSPAGAWFEMADGAGLHVSERAGPQHPDPHFAIVVPDFAALLDRLAAAGADWTEQSELFGGRRGFTRDPAGNRVEIIEDPAGS